VVSYLLIRITTFNVELLDGQAAENGSAVVNFTGGFYDAGDNINFVFPGAYICSDASELQCGRVQGEV
jgi:hypothetical protein